MNYNSSSKGLVAISSMHPKHLKHAILILDDNPFKMNDEWLILGALKQSLSERSRAGTGEVPVKSDLSRRVEELERVEKDHEKLKVKLSSFIQ